MQIELKKKTVVYIYLANNFVAEEYLTRRENEYTTTIKQKNIDARRNQLHRTKYGSNLNVIESVCEGMNT